MPDTRDPRPPIREYLRQIIEQRGQTVADAEREMGIAHTTLARVLAGETSNPGNGTIQHLADYLGLPFNAVRDWFYRDYQRSARYPTEHIPAVTLDAPTLTWYGMVGPTYDPPKRRENGAPDCSRCAMYRECRRLAYVGLPLPCERMLPREIVPEHAAEQMGVEVGV